MGATQNSAAKDRVPVSVVVLTRNEALNIEDCLRSVEWAGEVFVVDSLSEDRTVEIARTAGAQSFLHAFNGYADQRNWALENLPFRNEWVLMLDADERVTSGLAEEIAQALQDGSNGCDGFYLRRRLIFLGRWLKHGGIYPTWILRLFKRHHVFFEERLVNEHAILSGQAGYLQSPFDHCDHRSVFDWIAKHNRYSDFEAREYLQEKLHGGFSSTIPARWRGSQTERKRWVKLKIWNRLPLFFRPFTFFFLNYVARGGFLDGREGFIYHVLWSFWVRFLTDIKILEQQRFESQIVVPATPAALQIPEHRTKQRPATEDAPTRRQIQALFNKKAVPWMIKYSPAGPLNSRLENFTRRLRELCPAPGSVLDFGCGTGDIAAAIANGGYQVTACDIADAMIGVARSNWAKTPVQWVLLDPAWTVLPFEPSSFSVVVAASVFEYLEDVRGVSAELCRVMQPGGVLLFSVPNPFSRLRRMEAFLRRALPQGASAFADGRLGRVGPYLSYLRLSQNRFTPDCWKDVLRQVGLRPLNEDEFAADLWRRSNSPMMLLGAQKAFA